MISVLPSGKVGIDGDVPVLTGGALQVLTENVLAPWGTIADEEAARVGIDGNHLLSIIYAESQGNEKAVSPDGGFGLGRIGRPAHLDDVLLSPEGGSWWLEGMTGQLTSKGARQGLSDEELLDGPTNIAATANWIAAISEGKDLSLPELAATYNAGSVKPSTKNRWGFVSSPGYIDRVVAANNTLVDLGPRAGSGSGGFLIGVTAFVGAVLLFRAFKNR